MNSVMARAGVEIARDVKTLAAEIRTIITSLPKPAALDATVKAIVGAGVDRRIIVEMSTFAIDDKLEAERTLRRAGHVMGYLTLRLRGALDRKSTRLNSSH